MISEQTVSTIRHLLKEGKLSRRKIALQLGISRSAIRHVELESGREPSIDNGDFKEKMFCFPKGPHRRCCHCGAFVQLPCLACQVRNWQKNRQGIEPSPETQTNQEIICSRQKTDSG